MFFLLTQKEENILVWFFDSVKESIEDSIKNSTQNYLVSFKLIENLTSLYAKCQNKKEKFVELILIVFRKFVADLDLNNLENYEYNSNFLETFKNVIYNLNLISNNEKILFEIIENLLNIVIECNQPNVQSQSRNLIVKSSFVFKAFSLQLKESELSGKFLEKVESIFLNSNQSGTKFEPFEVRN